MLHSYVRSKNYLTVLRREISSLKTNNILSEDLGETPINALAKNW